MRALSCGSSHWSSSRLRQRARTAERQKVTTLSTNSTLSDLDKAKKQVSEMIRSMDPKLMCTIPEETASGIFQLAISNNTRSLCLSLSEDDLFDFIEDPSAMKQIRGRVEQLIRDLRCEAP